MEPNLVAQLLLVGLQDDGNPHPAAAALDYGLAGALLVELASRGRISLAGDAVTVVDATPVGDPVLDRGLASIAAGEPGLRTQEWINWLREGLREAAIDQLVEAGLLRRERHKMLWIIPDERFPASEGVRAGLRRRLATALDGDDPVDARTGALLSLIRATGLEEAAFPGRPRAEVRDRIEARRSAAWSDGGTQAAVAEVYAALLALVTVVFMSG